jgi:hypothetical protein
MEKENEPSEMEKTQRRAKKAKSDNGGQFICMIQSRLSRSSRVFRSLKFLFFFGPGSGPGIA